MQLALPLAPTPTDALPAPLDFYFVRHRRARRYLLRVDLDGRIRVTIPRGGSRREAILFARRNLAWIHEQRSRLTPRRFDAVAEAVWSARAREELPPLVRERARDLGITVSRVGVRNQRSRWGSCSRSGAITLNWRLLLMPDWVRDYVIVHELMHRRRMDHSRAFWALVAGVYPNYQEAIQWLREHGSTLR
jgi:predicted metal-dependent hydrolase